MIEACVPQTHPNASRGQFVYEALREAIVSGYLETGRKVGEVEISEWLNVSRTPVREALKRLEAEGLLQSSPSRGLTVTVLSLEQTIELFEMREALEGLAAHLAAKRATDEDIDAMQAILAEEAGGPQDPKTRLEVNDRFHNALYVAAHNRYVLISLKGIRDFLALMRSATKALFVPSDFAHKHHLEIFQAIEQGDTGAAEKIARQHIRESRRMRLRLLAEVSNSPHKKASDEAGWQDPDNSSAKT